MVPNAMLDAIIAREIFSEILGTLTPHQLAVVALRLDGLSFVAVEDYLGLSNGCSYQRMKGPRRDLPRRFPHLATMLEGDS